MKYERWKEPFDRAGEWLVRRFPGLLVGKQGQQNAASLKMLRTTKNTITLQAYYERKFSRIWLWVFRGKCVGWSGRRLKGRGMGKEIWRQS